MSESLYRLFNALLEMQDFSDRCAMSQIVPGPPRQALKEAYFRMYLPLSWAFDDGETRPVPRHRERDALIMLCEGVGNASA